MSFEPHMWATFCDDVRQEVGNKVSYMGIYGANLIVPSLPTTLLKLCCILTVRIPAISPPKQVTLKLLRDEEVIFEADAIQAAMNESTAKFSSGESDTHVMCFSVIAQLPSFQITKRCFLKARAVVDGKELRGGTLELLAADRIH